MSGVGKKILKTAAQTSEKSLQSGRIVLVTSAVFTVLFIPLLLVFVLFILVNILLLLLLLILV